MAGPRRSAMRARLPPRSSHSPPKIFARTSPRLSASAVKTFLSSLDASSSSRFPPLNGLPRLHVHHLTLYDKGVNMTGKSDAGKPFPEKKDVKPADIHSQNQADGTAADRPRGETKGLET